MYVNGDYRGDNALGKLMHDFSTPDADKMYFNELASNELIAKSLKMTEEQVKEIVKDVVHV